MASCGKHWPCHWERSRQTCSASATTLQSEVGLDFATRRGCLALHPAVLPERDGDRYDGRAEEQAGDRPGDEEPGVGVGHDRAHQVDLDLVAEDHAEDERRERKAELHHEVA